MLSSVKYLIARRILTWNFHWRITNRMGRQTTLTRGRQNPNLIPGRMLAGYRWDDFPVWSQVIRDTESPILPSHHLAIPFNHASKILFTQPRVDCSQEAPLNIDYSRGQDILHVELWDHNTFTNHEQLGSDVRIGCHANTISSALLWCPRKSFARFTCHNLISACNPRTCAYTIFSCNLLAAPDLFLVKLTCALSSLSAYLCVKKSRWLSHDNLVISDLMVLSAPIDHF